MNNEIKVSLTVTLQGGVMLSKEECLKTTQKTIEKRTKSGKVYKKTINVQVEDWNKMDKHTLKVADKDGKDPEVITFYTRKYKPVTRTLNIYKEAYDYMTSQECPKWVKPYKWKQMSPKERLLAHLQRIAEDFGGKILSYKVFDD